MKRDLMVETLFPGLAHAPYEVTSPFDPSYNCIAWAAGDNSRWWEPDPMGIYYWPDGVPRTYELSSYQAAFASIGFVSTSSETFSDRAIRVALFAKGNTAKHASRQLGPERWTSKLGQDVDISHLLHSLSGEIYGKVALLMAKPTQPMSG